MMQTAALKTPVALDREIAGYPPQADTLCAVQASGVVMFVDPREFRVGAISDTITQRTGRDPAVAIGENIDWVTGVPGFSTAIGDALIGTGNGDRVVIECNLPPHWDGTVICAFHWHNMIVIEMIAEDASQSVPLSQARRVFRSFHQNLIRIQNPKDAAQIVLEGIQQITGYTHHAISLFDRGGNICEIGDKARAGFEQVKNLPAMSSMPLRSLFAIRYVPDVKSPVSMLIPARNPRTGTPFDLSHALLGAPDPTHCDWLGGLNANAELQLVMYSEGKRLAAVQCMHERPFAIPLRHIMMCQKLVERLARLLLPRH